MDRHLVSRVVFDVAMPSPGVASALQDRLGAFSTSRLHGVIDRCIEGLGIADASLRIDRLDLDLGEMSSVALEDTLEHRLIEALGDALRKSLVAGHAPLASAAPGDGDSRPAALDSLRHYLMFGQRHWRTRTQDGDLSAILRHALETDPGGTASLLKRLWAHATVRQRVVWQIDPGTVNALLGIVGLAPGLSRFETLARWHRQQPLGRASPEDFERAMRSVLLRQAFATPRGEPGLAEADPEAGQGPVPANPALAEWGEGLNLRMLAQALDVPLDRFIAELTARIAQDRNPVSGGPEVDPRLRADRVQSPSAPFSADDPARVADPGRPFDDEQYPGLNGTPKQAQPDTFGARPLAPPQTDGGLWSPAPSALQDLRAILQGAPPGSDLRHLAALDFGALLVGLARSDPEGLRSVLTSLHDPQMASQALVRHFPVDALDTAILQLRPDIGGFVLTVQIVASRVGPPIAQAARLQALILLVRDHADTEDPAGWVWHLVGGMATALGLEVSVLARRLAESADASGSGEARFAAVLDVLGDLWPGTAPPPGLISGILPLPEDVLTEDIDRPQGSGMPSETALQRFLAFGSGIGDDGGIRTRLRPALHHILDAAPDRFAAWLRVQGPNPYVEHRIALLLDQPLFSVFLRAFLSAPDAAAVETLGVALRATSWAAATAQLQRSVTAFVLSLLQGPDTRLRGTEVADQVLHRFARDMNTTAAQLAERIAPHLPAGASDHLTGLAARLAEIARNLRHAGRPATDAMESDELAERMDLSVHAVMVGNAGLVLLWPDLPLYFERAGLMSGRDFATPAQHRRAVLLLHHLATGSPAAPEHALTLSKLLCGLEPQTPVEPSVTLSARDIDLANGLLQGLCQRWSPLKRTSIEGLRETFLCRRGILRRPEAAGPLTLHVEAGPFDVLLDRLPWPISTVRTPWMREALFVNWR